jgi:nicotinamide riboside kinase
LIVVNINAGPSAGKSTLAADVYAKLKRLHINVELVREYAKDVVYSDSLSTLKDQVHILGEQHHRQFVLDGQCDVAITDSPILLCSIYNTFYTEYKAFDALALEAHHRYDNLNYVLARTNEFQAMGRVEDQQKSIEIDGMIESFLRKNDIRYTVVSNPFASDQIVQDVLDRLANDKD